MEGGEEMNWIPSDEDLDRASREMNEDWRNVDEVNENVERRFKKTCPLHYFFLMPQRDDEFRAYVFLEKDKDIKACESSGILQELTDFVYAELERAGRGKREDITVVFEFDSDENVTAKFGGDYFLRLR